MPCQLLSPWERKERWAVAEVVNRHGGTCSRDLLAAE